MIVFAAIVPHAPFLLPTIGKQHRDKLKKTAEAMTALEQQLYVTRPDTLCIISPHGGVLADAFGINLSSEYKTSFKEFGDHKTSRTFRSDFMLIDRIQRSLRKDTAFTLNSEPSLDYGVGVPLHLLSEHLANPTVVPITTSALDLKAHFDFGKALRDELLNTTKRVALIASADLSHTLTKDAPAGYVPKSAEFDASVQQLLSTRNVTGLIQLGEKDSAKMADCGLRPILVAMGILDGINYTAKVLSYEGPLGIGYLVSTLDFG